MQFWQTAVSFRNTFGGDGGALCVGLVWNIGALVNKSKWDGLAYETNSKEIYGVKIE